MVYGKAVRDVIAPIFMQPASSTAATCMSIP